MEERVISTQIQEEDLTIETSLRPQTLIDYIGQAKTKENLKVYIEAAKLRGEALDHVLFFGPPGLGKTTLAGIIANGNAYEDYQRSRHRQTGRNGGNLKQPSRRGSAFCR